jgi:hypothetical protein
MERTLTGRPAVRFCNSLTRGFVALFCLRGHVHTTTPAAEWPGSRDEARAGDAAWSLRCDAEGRHTWLHNGEEG